MFFRSVLRLFCVAIATASSSTAVRAQSNYATPYTFSTLAGVIPYGSTDALGNAARFLGPYGVAAAPDGTVYVADRENQTIRKITSGGIVTTFAGAAGSSGSTDGIGSTARFNLPSGVAVDSAGNVFVAEGTTIRKITSSGLVTTFAGTTGSRGSIDGTGAAARFSSATGVAVDSAGNVYVADSSNNSIRKITSGGVVTTLAGPVTGTTTAGVSGSADGTGSEARFKSPQAVAVDSAGNIYVADTANHTIRKITPGAVVTTLAGSPGASGSVDGVGSAARFGFTGPVGVAVDSVGNVYATDPSNNSVRKIAAGGVVTTWVGGSNGSADGTGTAARFNYPAGIAVDNAGTVYVGDWRNYSVRRVTSAAVVTTLAGPAGAGSSVDGTLNVARFNLPSGVALDGAGNLFVADTNNSTIRKITSSGVVTTFAGSPGNAGSADGAGGTARFNAPSGVAVDNAGNVYVADAGNFTIRKITSGGVVSTLAGFAGSEGTVNGVGSTARFANPKGVAVDGAGNVYVADTDNAAIRKITSSGVVTTFAGFPVAIGSVDGVGSVARFFAPYGVAVDSAGTVYVADGENANIRKITSNGVVTTVAGTALTYGSADGTGSSASFTGPTGIAVDGAGNLYVADASTSTIRKITSAGVVTTLAGSAANGGSSFPGSSDGIGSAALFRNPLSLAVNSVGNLYVADSGNNTIRFGTPPPVPVISAGPNSLTLSPGSTAVFSLTVGPADLGATYQWRRDGVAISGATSATFVLAGATTAQAGSYTCAVTNANGTTVSAAATLAFSLTTDFGRLVNLSILTSLASGEGLFTVGTVIGGAGTSGTKPLLVRAAGPTLGAAPFNISGVLPNPKLDFFSGSTLLASNDDWAGTAALTNAFTSVGAFPYVNASSKDAAYYNPALASGSYTVQVSDVGGATGTVIAELYDATPAANFTATTPRLINVSVLKQIPANGILTVGFVIGGSTAKTVLIRAVGPTLSAAPFNVSGAMADPQLTLFSGQTAFASNDNWGGDPQLTTAGNNVGAFALSSATSKDAMLLITLPPGAYTAQASGVAGSAGSALVEVYEVP